MIQQSQMNVFQRYLWDPVQVQAGSVPEKYAATTSLVLIVVVAPAAANKRLAALCE